MFKCSGRVRTTSSKVLGLLHQNAKRTKLILTIICPLLLPYNEASLTFLSTNPAQGNAPYTQYHSLPAHSWKVILFASYFFWVIATSIFLLYFCHFSKSLITVYTVRKPILLSVPPPDYKPRKDRNHIWLGQHYILGQSGWQCWVNERIYESSLQLL